MWWFALFVWAAAIMMVFGLFANQDTNIDDDMWLLTWLDGADNIHEEMLFSKSGLEERVFQLKQRGIYDIYVRRL